MKPFIASALVALGLLVSVGGVASAGPSHCPIEDPFEEAASNSR